MQRTLTSVISSKKQADESHSLFLTAKGEILNRRHKTVLALSLAIGGLALLSGVKVSEALGIILVGASLAWFIGSQLVLAGTMFVWRHRIWSAIIAIVGIGAVYGWIRYDAYRTEQREAAAKAAAQSWNRTAIRAEFVELATSDKKDSIGFWYTLTNTTDEDYRIENMSGITTAISMHGETDYLYSFSVGGQVPLISLETPLIIPAHRKTRTILSVAFPMDKSVPDDASEAAVTMYKKDVMTFLRSKYSKMQGFVLMDEGTRCEIDFPAGAWSETADKWEQYVAK